MCRLSAERTRNRQLALLILEKPLLPIFVETHAKDRVLDVVCRLSLGEQACFRLSARTRLPQAA